jgi:hypothetical protein
VTAPRLAAAALACVLAGCAARVPAAPVAARAQDPRAADPGDWRGRGRLRAGGLGPGLAADCLLRVAGGRARAVFLSDEGLLLADVEATDEGPVVHRAAPGLGDRAILLATLIAPYARPPETLAGWRRGVRFARTTSDRRLSGGDPLLLRRVDGPGWPVTVSDYRPAAGGMVPRSLVADGPFTLELRLLLTEVDRLAPPAATAPERP